MRIVPVVLAGGIGSRLWPLSRQTYSKPFIALAGGLTLFQDTVLRLHRLPDSLPGIVVCQEAQRFLVSEQLQEVGLRDWGILLEPFGRGTAPAAACAALWHGEADDTVLLISPADHRVGQDAPFHQAIARGVVEAQAGRLVLFGVVPSHGETGFGYIQRGKPLTGPPAGHPAYEVGQFIEKPDLPRATAMVASGDYYWNSGLFLFRGGRYLEELGRFSPEILDACQQASHQVTKDLSFFRLEPTAYGGCPNNSIDWAVMEKTAAATVVPLAVGWSDVGSWSSLWQEGEKDQEDNVVTGDVLLAGVAGSLVHSQNRLVAVLGCRDVVVVETSDAVLVADRHQCQDVKGIVTQLQQWGRPEAVQHRRDYRPWGMFETMDRGEGFQVKRLTVRPGASLSLQYHLRRQEHWVVVRGVAEVWRQTEQFLLQAGESAFIPVGAHHRLANPGPDLLEIIEVQTGEYLGEDDIVRLEDVYGRCV